MKLYDMLKYDEGERLELYKDTEGYWTIGIGRLVTKSPSKADAIRILGGSTITKEQSEQMFNEDIQKALRGVQLSTLNSTYIKLDEARRSALVNMVFQLGLTGVQAFKKMIQHLDLGNWSAAASEALDSKWAKQTPNRAYRVTQVIKTGSFKFYQ
ncbi:glycoside hydrolase family protein [Pantoea stewartii]|uniref:glycoside hydrolase family protein n=1 Tax=Pantoea stewartii TaxID=66269 RepID=UPI0019817D93|nr:glycoside hydrolase family protein [Pantoea stewartii]